VCGKADLPFYEGQPVITLDTGTVEVLNANLRILQQVSGTVTTASTSYTIDLTTSNTINSVGVKWSAASVALTFQVSDDNVTWTT